MSSADVAARPVPARGGAPRRPLVLRHVLRRRRRSTSWWSVAVALTAVLVAASYPSVQASAEAFDSCTESLPEGVVDVLGAAAGPSTPAGYLSSQFHANMLPLLLTVLGTGAAAWSVAGAEGDGTLEMLLANPVRRSRVALERAVGVVLVCAVVALVVTVVLVAVGPVTHLRSGGLAPGAVWLASLGACAMALLLAAAAFAVAAATGRRGAALAAGSAFAAGTYVLYGLTGFVDALRPLR